METQKLLIEIDINADEATQEIIKQRTALSDLKAEVNTLKAANEKLYAEEKVDTAAINANKAAIVEKEGKIKNLTAEIKVNEKVVQAATKTTKDETGAYAKLNLEYQVAAQKAKDMAVVHGVNSEQARKATEQAHAMDKQLKEVDASVGQNQRSVGDYTNSIIAAYNALKKKRETLQTEKNQLTENKNVLIAYKSTLDATSDEYKENEVAIINNKLALNQNKLALDQNNLELKEHKSQLMLGERGISGFGDKLNTMPGILGKVGSSITMVGQSMKVMLLNPVILVVAAIAAVGTAVVGLVKNGMEFNQEMTKVKAISGATKIEYDQLKESAIQLGRETQKTAIDVAKMQLELAKMGFTVPEILAAQRAIINMSVATGEDLTKTTEILSSTTKAFGLTASDTQRVADVMSATLNKSASGLSDFGEAMKYVAPLAKASGVSIEEASAMIGVLADNGIKGSQAGTSLRAMMIGMAKEGGTLTQKLNSLSESELGLKDASEEVVKTAATAFLVLQQNSDKLPQFTKDLQNSSGATDELARIMGDTLTGDVKKLGGAWDSFLLGIDDGEGVFTNMARWTIQALTETVKAIGTFGKMVSDAFTWVNNAVMYSDKALWGVLQTVKTVFSAVGNAWEALKKGDFKGVANAFKGIGDNIKSAFDMKSVTAIINTNKEIKENEKAVRAAVKADAEMQKKKEENAKKQEELNKTEKAARDARQKEIEKAQAAELKDLKDNITLKTNAYKDSYDKNKLLDKDYYEGREKGIEEIFKLEVAEIEKKKKYGKLTIEEEQLALAAANKNKMTLINQLYSDMNKEMIEQLDQSLKLEDIAQKQSLLGVIQIEQEKHDTAIKGINDKYEAEKKRIELSITDEKEKGDKLKVLNAQYNLDIATEDQKYADALKKQKLTDQAELLQSEMALMKEGIDKEYAYRFAQLEKEKQDRLAKVTEGSEAEYAIREEYAVKEAELERQKNVAKAQQVVEYAQQAAEVLSAINDFITALGERELDNFSKQKNKELELWAQANKGKEGFEEEYAARKKKIDEDYEEKKAELEYEAAKRNKAMQIVNAIINGASAVIANLAVWPLAVAAGILAAAQLAVIIATPIPDNRKGSSGTVSGSISIPSAPNTTPTTNGVINDKTYGSNDVINTKTTNAIQNNSGVYVPVLVTSDLTKEYDKSYMVKVLNEV